MLVLQCIFLNSTEDKCSKDKRGQNPIILKYHFFVSNKDRANTVLKIDGLELTMQFLGAGRRPASSRNGILLP